MLNLASVVHDVFSPLRSGATPAVEPPCALESDEMSAVPADVFSLPAAVETSGARSNMLSTFMKYNTIGCSIMRGTNPGPFTTPSHLGKLRKVASNTAPKWEED